MHQLITVIGPIGSGKTTICQTLAQELQLPLVDADMFEENPFLEPYIKDPKRWAFSVELFFTIKRLKKLKVLPTMLKKSSVIVDSGLIMSQIYTKNQLVQGHMTASEWNFYEEIIADYQTTLPKTNIILALTAKPQTQFDRIHARGRSFEAGYTLEYLKQITDRFHEFIHSLDDQTDIKVVTYDTDHYNPTTPAGLKHLKTLLEFLT